MCVRSPSIEDYRAAGRAAGKKYLAAFRGDRGLDALMAHRNPQWVDNALANAINGMADRGAPPDKVEAWSAGFSEVLNAYSAEVQARNRIDEVVMRMFEPDALPGRGRDPS